MCKLDEPAKENISLKSEKIAWTFGTTSPEAADEPSEPSPPSSSELLTDRFEEVFEADLDRNENRELLAALATSVAVVQTAPLKLRLKSLDEVPFFKLLKSPSTFADDNFRDGLENNFSDTNEMEQDLFGVAESLFLRETMMWPLARAVGNFLEQCDLLRVFKQFEAEFAKVPEQAHNCVTMRDTLADANGARTIRVRADIALEARLLGALNQTRSPLATAFPAAQHQALELLGVRSTTSALALIDAVQAGGWWWPFPDVCLACDNPAELVVDEKLRLHNESGMAACFRDGWGLWAIHGVAVSEDVVLGRLLPLILMQHRCAYFSRAKS